MPQLPIDVNVEPIRRAGGLDHSHLTAEQAGAGIGRALGGLGDAFSGLAADMAAKEKQKQNTDATIEALNATTDIQKYYLDTVQGAPADGAGIADKTDAYTIKRFDDLIANAASPDQARFYREKQAQFRASMLPNAYRTEATQAAGFALDQSKLALGNVYSSIQRDPSMFDTFYQQGLDLIDNHYGLPAKDRMELRQTYTATAAQTYFQSAIDNASTEQQTTALRRQLNDPKDPVATLLKPDDLHARVAQVANKENAIITGKQAEANSAAESLTAELARGGKPDPAYVQGVTDNAIKYASPAALRKLGDQLNVSKWMDGLTGQTRGALERASNPNIPVGSVEPNANKFLRGVLQPGHNPQHIDNMDPVFQNRLAGLLSSAPPSVGDGHFVVLSGFRTYDEQVAIYQKSGGRLENGKWVGGDGSAARPGNSVHEAGRATDIGWRDSKGNISGLSGMPPAAVKYLHDNAAKFGIAFPLDGTRGTPNEPWHAEMVATGGVAAFRAPAKYAPMYEAAGRQYGVSSQLLAAQGKQESGFDPTVVSSKGAVGIAQFMPDTAKEWVKGDPKDPEAAINGQAAYMRTLLDKYHNDTSLALMAYNWGMGNVDDWMKSGSDPTKVPKETRDYVTKILGSMGDDPSRMTDFRVRAATQAKTNYDTGMKADPLAFTQKWVPQFFEKDSVDVNTGEGLTQRMTGVLNARDYLGEKDIPLLSKPEIDQIGENLTNMTTEQKLSLTANVSKQLGDHSDEFWKLIKDKDPDIAIAGTILAHHPEAYGLANDLIRAGGVIKAKWPDQKPDAAVHDYFSKTLEQKEHFPGDVAQVFSGVPGRAEDLQRAADALYIYRHGGKPWNKDAYRAVLNEVMVGSRVEPVNGAPMLLPPGVSAQTFEKALDRLTPDDLTASSVKGGSPVYLVIGPDGKPAPRPVTTTDIANEGHFEAYGPDVYAIRLANDGGYVLDSTKVGTTIGYEGQLYLIHMDANTVKDIGSRPTVIEKQIGAPQGAHAPPPSRSRTPAAKGTAPTVSASPPAKNFTYTQDAAGNETLTIPEPPRPSGGLKPGGYGAWQTEMLTRNPKLKQKDLSFGLYQDWVRSGGKF